MISLTPEQVQARLARLGLEGSFSHDEQTHFATTPIVPAATRTFAFPIPAQSHLTLRNIRAAVGTDPRHQPSVFDHAWYETEDFMERPCPPGWHALSMDILPESQGQPVDYVLSLTPLPLAVEVVLMLFLHFVDSGEQLLMRKHTWCSDVASLGRRVTVGAFGRNGVFLSGHPEDFRSRGLGVCARYL